MAKIHLRPILYLWMRQHARSVAAGFASYSSIFLIGYYLTVAAAVIAISLIPAFLSRYLTASGDVYCINNYTMTVAFQIPFYLYRTDLTVTTSTPYSFFGGVPDTLELDEACLQADNLTLAQTATTVTTCDIVTNSTITPNLNGRVLNSYALSNACYRALQSCYPDPELTACILSGCIVVSEGPSSGTGTYTNYQVVCNAKIYYRTRCTDAAVNSRLNYSSAQQNSACRQQRLERINTCLNSNLQLSDVPCMISVSSGTGGPPVATCSQTATIGSTTATFYIAFPNREVPVTIPMFTRNSQISMPYSSANTEFSASDQNDGHAYKIISIHSQYYSSSQRGALYCGGISRAQIATAVEEYIDSQSEPI